uniref:Tetraspanin 32 n=1 Tax=Otus sunia TaxID=257818 RepID=A0A8C8AK98_9STRI
PMPWELLPCQSLPKILLFQLLGLSIATLSTVTHYGLHFTLISNISLENNSYRVIHHAGTSGLRPSESTGAAKSPKAIEGNAEVLREEAGGFFCFALAFCGLIPAACWRYTHSTEVEDSMMDVYDLVYEEVRRNTSSFRRHELTAIHEAVSCLSALAETLAAAVLQGVSLSSQDCLQEIQDFLKKHMDFVSTILGVYGMILTSFLWFSIHFSNNLDRKGKYILRESSWCRRRSEVTHKIPREGAAWGRQWDVCLVFPLPALRAVVCFQAGQSGRLCHC